MGMLDTLLDIQSHDTTTDQVRHRRATLPEREELASLRDEIARLDGQCATLINRRDELTAQERAFAEESASLEVRAKNDEAKLYSGEIASPRELQALQADVEQLRRHQRGVEDRQLGLMEQREGTESELAEIDEKRADVVKRAEALAAALGEAEAICDEEMAAEEKARAALASELADGLLDDYEQARKRAGGIGAARLVGDTCQGCHLSLPATEVVRLRKQTDDVASFCDNCGCILVPS